MVRSPSYNRSLANLLGSVIFGFSIFAISPAANGEPPTGFANKDPCHEYYSKLPVKAVPKDKKAISFKKAFGSDSPELVMGLDEDGHVFLVAGKARFDGEMMYRASRVREQTTPFFENGVAFRFTDVPQEKISEIEKSILTNGAKLRKLSCLHGACDILKTAGIEPTEGMRAIPSQALNGIIRSGFTGPNGMPTSVMVYELGDATLKSMQSNFSYQQNLRGSTLIFLYGSAGTMFVFMGAKVIEKTWDKN